MKRSNLRRLAACGALGVALALVGCGPSSTTPPPPPPPTGIGPDGGTVTGPNGSQAVVPAGALATTVDIAIASPGTGAPVFPPDDVLAVGEVYEFTPHGQGFSQPVTVRIPFDASKVPAGETPRLYRAEPGGRFAILSGATVSGGFVEVAVNGFSYFAPGVPLVQTFELGPERPTHLAAYPGGGVVVTGLTGSAGKGFVRLVAPNGTVTWNAEITGEFTGPLTGPRVAAGPTGNVYVATATSRDEMGVSLAGRSDVRVTSFNPQGVERAGWPQRVRMNYTNWPAAIVADSQDNVFLYGGTSAQNVTQHDTFRPWLASWTGSGTVLTAAALVDFGGTEPNRRILPADFTLKGAGGAYLSARVIGQGTGVDPGTGVQVLSYDSAGQVTTGFPVRLSMDSPDQGAPLALGANDDLYVLGTQLYGLASDGTTLSGLPAALALPSGATLSGQTQPPLSRGAGNFYFPGEITGRTDGVGGVDVFVQSLTSQGGTRARFPRYVGTVDDDVVVGSVLDSSSGGLWLLWYSDGATRTAWLSRLPAN